MKLNISLKAKISIVFAFLFVLLVATATPMYFYQEVHSFKKVADDYERLMHTLHGQRLSRDEVINYLQGLNFSLTQNPREIVENLDRPVMRRKHFEAFLQDDRFYIHVVTPHFRLLMLDNSKKPEKSYIVIFASILIAILFAFIYYLIIKNINSTQHQLKSRQLFLRTVMHELKTPIAKGRIVSELIDDEVQKNRIITIFEKLNVLIDDFAKVEEVVSNNFEINRYNHYIDTALQKSIQMLMLDKTDNILLENISKRKINIDLDLFALAMKNLIDNALKYSSDTKVTIKEESDRLTFISNGDALKKPLNEYFKPFHNETKDKNHGMGLGLYIIHSILEMHDMKLAYEYKDNQNIFSIIL